MNVKLSNPGGPCECMPALLSTHEGDVKCAVCAGVEDSNNSKSQSIVTLIWKCRTSATTVHICQRCVCAACISVFEQRLDDEVSKVYGGVEKLTCFPPSHAQMEQFAARTRLGLVFCAGCMRHELKDGPLFMCCGKCERAAYCTRECQRSHWRKEHRAECQHRPAPTQFTSDSSGVKSLCKCLKAPDELHEVSALARGHCSALGCFNNVCAPYHLHVHVVQCTRGDYKKEETHALAIIYCGVACRRRAQIQAAK